MSLRALATTFYSARARPAPGKPVLEGSLSNEDLFNGMLRSVYGFGFFRRGVLH
jgi:hypothetical protein